MEILALLIIIYACKHAITDTKGAAAKSRKAYMASADKRFPGMPKGKRAAHAARHDLGWALSQLGHGFPATRHGFAQGWHTSREAHHQAMLARQEAKTRHLETKAGLIPQLQEYRERQRAALEQIRSGKAPSTPEAPGEVTPEGKEGTPEGSSPEPVPTRRADGKPETEADKRFFDKPESGYTGPVDRDGNVPEPGSPGLDSLEALQNNGSPGDTTVTEDHWDDPLPGEEGSAAPEEGTPEGTSPETSPTSTASTEGTSMAGEIKRDDEGSGLRSPSYGRPAGSVTYVDENGARVRPSYAPGGSSGSTGGTGMAGDTSYDQIHADMDRDITQAEQAAAEQQQALAAHEAAAASAQQALTQTNASIDAAAGLDLDGDTSSSMMDHAEAQKAAKEAADEALESNQRAQAAFARVQETAQNVKDILTRNHGQLSEAHKDAPVEAAEKQFYAA